MKTLYILTILILFIPSVILSQWSQQNSGTTKRLLSCFFISENVGWAAGDQGTILKTTNGGAEWVPQMVPSDYNVHSIVFVDSLNGFAVLYKFLGSNRLSQIIKTTNGGNNWSIIGQYLDFVLISISFADAYNGIAVGSDGVILITTDKGNSWYFYDPLFAAWYTATYSKSSNLFWVGGNTYGYMLRTTDLGSRWSYIAIPIEAPINSIYFTDFFNGWACSESGNIMKTINSGLDWEVLNFSTSNALNDLYFFDKDRGWIIGSGGKIFYTSNSGNNWINQSNYSNDFYCIHMVDSLTGWIVGSGGMILKTTNGGGGAISVENQSKELRDYYLFQNYPNPFNPVTTISWNSPNSGNALLEIFDVLGNKVDEISVGRISSGYNEITYDAKNLSSGVYFYQLSAKDDKNKSNFISRKKMTLIK
ncbi:YCF48-related protein [Ignavibacterium sp.]|uniref:T9SS type A sorting domain-containing protein n=1 Tax=Ignavibacterium sp. TaxID=2651167 RepID=UPI0021FB80CB|nr:YCF48-related protein [Ignavibacterium sp.]BDQ03133.1 MAG: hypothetical protein KatS3mg037_1708 [Ignavibacterium sp.]